MLLLGELNRTTYAAHKVFYGSPNACAAAVAFESSKRYYLFSQEGQIQTVRLSFSYCWHWIHLLMIPVLTKTSTQPTQEVIQGQAVEPAAALAAVCMNKLRQKACWLPY